MTALLAAVLLVASLVPPAPGWSASEVEREIVAAAHSYDVPAAPLVALARCESRLNPDAVGRAGERGVFQWLPTPPGGLWEYTPAGRAGLSPLDMRLDVAMATWAYRYGGDVLMAEHWTCWAMVRGGRP